MPADRPRDAARTRTAILEAARLLFAEAGYAGTTVRAVAARAGVDAALVSRYFGGKAGLLAAALELRVDLPDLREVPADRWGAALVPVFVAAWERQPAFLALLRTSATHPDAAAALRSVFAGQIEPALAPLAPDAPAERAAMWGALVIGIAYSRYVLGTEPLASLDTDRLAALVGPMLRAAMTDPLPGSELRSHS